MAGAYCGGCHFALPVSIVFGIYGMNALGADLNARIDNVYQLLLPKETLQSPFSVEEGLV